MSKRKRIIASLITLGIISSNLGVVSHANTNGLALEDIMAIPGLVQIHSTYGDNVNPSYIFESVVTDNKLYGLPLFTQDQVVDFIEWLIAEDGTYGEIFD